jgi:hypothetical protein
MREGDNDVDRAEAMIEAGMSAAGAYRSRQVSNARRIWRDFRRLAEAFDGPPGLWAAAAEYAVVRIDFVEGVTLAAVARRYKVSPRAVSTRFGKIQDRLELMPFDPRYSTERLDDEEFDLLEGLVPGPEDAEESIAAGLPFREVHKSPEFREDVRGLVTTGRPFPWIVSTVARCHPPSDIGEYQQLVDVVQDVWNTTPRAELGGRTPEQADREA